MKRHQAGIVPFHISILLCLIAGLLNIVSYEAHAAPVIETYPGYISDILTEGTVSDHTISLSNTGDRTLSYRVSASDAEALLSFKDLTTYRTTRPPLVSSVPDCTRLVPGEILVRRTPGAAVTALSSIRNSMGATVKRYIQGLDLEIWRLPPAMHEAGPMIMSLHAISADRNVLYAEPNYIYTTAGTPNDPLFSQLWGMHNTGQTGGTDDCDIDAPEAWDIFKGSEDVVVAVIDTGVDYTHEDLAANMWRNEDEIPGNGIDDDGNGFIDDVYGYDFLNDDPDPADDHYHGTHCAGTIGAVGNNDIGVAGVTHDVQIMALKFLNQSGSGAIDDAVEAIVYAVDNGARVLSNSWGGCSFSYALEDAIVYANDHGVLFVAAAGNEYADSDIEPFYPAAYDVPNVISVAATDHNDNKAFFSNWGLISVDLGAPGDYILSTFPGDRYALLSGTSMATPHVAGAAALLMGYNPSLGFSHIKNTIMNNVDPVSSLAGKTVTGGRLNITNAFLHARPDWIDITGETQGDIPAGFSTDLTVRLDATDKAPGDYSAYIHFISNDPLNPDHVVPVNVTMLPDCCPPAAVNDLHVSAYFITTAQLRWTAVGDDGHSGLASEYDIRYSTVPLDDSTWDSAVQAAGEPGPGDPGTAENYEITGLSSDTHYWIGMKVRDNKGQLSDLSNVVEITTVANIWVLIAAGGYHSAALKTDGTLWAWGSNEHGQLGDGTTTTRNIPAQTGSDHTWVSVTAGLEFTLALKADGTLWGWGQNNYGQLGIGTNVDKIYPVQIGNENRWVSVTARGYHSLALKADGTLWAWGRNNYGQLGIGTTVDSKVPVLIESSSTWASVTAGVWHTLALKTDGTLWSWGGNNYGQLGVGTYTASYVPVRIGSDSAWISVAARGYHSLGLKADGTLWAWGRNINGQLGDGTTTDRNSPVPIGSAHTWGSVAAGWYHTVALASDGTLWAWGRNCYGQLGDGTTTDRNTPVLISSAHTWGSVAAGVWHTMALKDDGSLWTWGYNNRGQLGDGTWDQRTYPQMINVLPVADPGGPYSASEGQAILFDGSGSTDPDGKIVLYEWDVENNGLYEYSSLSPLCNHTYTQQGPYTIRLRVTDKFGASDQRETSAYITDSLPMADFTGSPANGDAPLTVLFTNNSTGYDSPLRYEWYFDGEDDGSPDATAVHPSHMYGPGVYSVLLKAIDSDSSINSLLRTNYITSCYPPAVIPGDPAVYSSLQDAYDYAGELDTIQSRDIIFTEDVHTDRNIHVLIEGGYDCLHSGQTGTTTVYGNITVSGGSVTIKSGKIAVTGPAFPPD